MKFKLTTLFASLLMTNVVSAATAIDLSNPTSQKLFFTNSAVATKKINSHTDINQTTHTRLQQTFAGYPVWNATFVTHTPKKTSLRNQSSMNGVIYSGLEKDLINAPRSLLNDEQKTKALQQAKTNYNKKSRTHLQAREETVNTIIFVDQNNQAHYAYLVSFYVDDNKTGAHRPTAILDAMTLQEYQTWDQVKTVSEIPEDPKVGGIGGNVKMGEMIYDGAEGHFPSLEIHVSKSTDDNDKVPGKDTYFARCDFSNNFIEVQDVTYDSEMISTPCYTVPNKHNNTYWVSLDQQETRWKNDEMNQGYSPALDAFYAATLINSFYDEWYQVPALVQEDKKTMMRLIMRVHYGRQYDNAFWDGKRMTFGDGGKEFYPLTSLDVAAHEIAHGFTQQHSNLDPFDPIMNALHEAFSDMAGVTTMYYRDKQPVWEIGASISKTGNALRFLDDPKKDGMSIDHTRDFNKDIEPHLVAGIFNKAFYLLATSEGWNVRKAFDVMINANMHYWTSSMKTFSDVANGVVMATKDLAVKDPSYKVADVKAAFLKVGIETKN